ncbi:MAG: cell envelope integrity protein TolA [Methylophilaceae bacterium]|nr:cell envelope integrity protein TolA [Methylophilaceae bacterium]
MSESIENLNKQCSNSKCKKELQGPVKYCPFCRALTGSESKSVPQEPPTKTEPTLEVEPSLPKEAASLKPEEPPQKDGGDTPPLYNQEAAPPPPPPPKLTLLQRILKLPLLIKCLVGLASLGLLSVAFHNQPPEPVGPESTSVTPSPVSNDTDIQRKDELERIAKEQEAREAEAQRQKELEPIAKEQKAQAEAARIRKEKEKPCPIDEIKAQAAGILNKGQWSNFASYINGQLDNNPTCASNKHFEVLQSMATPLRQYVNDPNPKTAATEFASLIDRYGEQPILVKFKRSFEVATEKSNDCVVSGGEWDPFRWVCKN